MIFTRIIVLVLSFVAGIWLMRSSEWLVRNFGRAGWAEKYLGQGGTYTAWKLGGIIVIILGFLFAVGTFTLTPEEGVLRPDIQTVPQGR